MSILSWWRKRQGILEKAVEPEYACISINEDYLIVRSCLSFGTIFDKINDSYPPPKDLLWGLYNRDETSKRGFFVYYFQLMEDHYGYKDRRHFT